MDFHLDFFFFSISTVDYVPINGFLSSLDRWSKLCISIMQEPFEH